MNETTDERAEDGDVDLASSQSVLWTFGGVGDGSDARVRGSSRCCARARDRLVRSAAQDLVVLLPRERTRLVRTAQRVDARSGSCYRQGSRNNGREVRPPSRFMSTRASSASRSRCSMRIVLLGDRYTPLTVHRAHPPVRRGLPARRARARTACAVRNGAPRRQLLRSNANWPADVEARSLRELRSLRARATARSRCRHRSHGHALRCRPCRMRPLPYGVPSALALLGRRAHARGILSARFLNRR